MLDKGFLSIDLLADTRLSESDLADPYFLVTENQARTYYRNAVALAGEQGIGLEVGWSSTLSDLGPQGLSHATARTVGEAMKVAMENRLFYNLLGNWQVEMLDQVMIHRMQAKESDESLRIFLLERGIGLLQAHVEELCGQDAKPLKLLLDYAKPEYHERYEEIFCCPVMFNQPALEIHYPISYLDLDVAGYDPQVAGTLKSLTNDLELKLLAHDNVTQDVRLMLRLRQSRFPSLEEVASNLAMSSRTLRRKLREQGTSFQELLDAERDLIAQDLLTNTTMDMQKIAEYCGFSDAHNFSQAFKRWQGVSPRDFRKSH